jgi:type I restriction enzyme M protein
MFVQSVKFVERHNGNRLKISVIGQESNPDTWRLAKMNLAIRGISYDLGERATSTFIDDQHKDIKVDFIMANPPFNLKNWRGKDELIDDYRWKGYEVPRKAMPNTRGFCICSQTCRDNAIRGVYCLPSGALNGGRRQEYKTANVIKTTKC